MILRISVEEGGWGVLGEGGIWEFIGVWGIYFVLRCFFFLCCLLIFGGEYWKYRENYEGFLNFCKRIKSIIIFLDIWIILLIVY